MSRIILYRVVSDKELPFEPNEIQRYIIEEFSRENCLFAISQIAHGTNHTRQQVKRAVNRLEKAGVVKRFHGGNK